MKVKDWFGMNTFIGGSYYSHNWPPENLLNNAKVKRFFMGCEYTSSTLNVFALRRSAGGGWGWEESLTDFKTLGNTTVVSILGGFTYQTMDGSIGARMPINIDADPYDSASYYTVARLCYNIAARWGSNTSASINDAELAANSLPSVAGLGILDYLEVLNEWDNDWHGSSVSFDAESYAVCLKTCYDAIKAADPNMKVLIGALYQPNITLYQDVKTEWVNRYGAWPSDLYFNYHRYINNGLGGGSRTGGDIPEYPAFPSYSVFGQVRDMDALNEPWFITEYGWDSSQDSIQSTPILKEIDGITDMSAEKSKGTLLVRAALGYALGKNCKMCVFFHVRNETNGGEGWLYATSGVYYRTGGIYYELDGVDVIDEFLSNVGECELPAILISSKSPYKVAFKNGSGKVFCTWTDNGPVQYSSCG